MSQHLHRDQPRCPAKLIYDDRQATLLPLQALEQLQEVHARRNKRWELNRFGQIDVRIEQQRPRI